MSKKMIAGLDIGNGYVKSCLNYNTLTDIDMPSAMAFNVQPKKNYDLNVAEEVADIYNRMDAIFDSPILDEDDGARFLIGNRAMLSGNDVEEFNADDGQSKSSAGLTNILTFACIAGKALQDYYTEKNALPTQELSVIVRAATALPITEYMAKRGEFAKKYMTDTHKVTICNFEKPIVVNITFEDVQVVAEGQAAQRAITSKGAQYLETLLADAKANGVNTEGLNAEHLLRANNTIGIDIGEGTVNFPVYTDGRFNPDVSFSMNDGYGKVLEGAMKQIEEENLGVIFRSRKQLTAFLMADEIPPSKQDLYNKVQNIVNVHISNFARSINRQYANLVKKIGALNDVTYVYGGGASALRYDLYSLLVASSQKYGNSPVIYFDKSSCQKLNKEGLYVIADAYAKFAAAQAKASK